MTTHLAALRRYAFVLARGTEEAEDLLQDCLAKAVASASQWQPGSDLRAWLFTLMHNLYLNQRRDAPPLAAVDIDEVRDQLPGTPGPSDDALDLERCLQRLPADQRAVLLLVGLEAMSYEETARILAVPVGTVMSRLSRARSRLRALMERAPELPTEHAPALRRLK